MPKARELPTQEVLQKLFHYDRPTGELFAIVGGRLERLKINVDRDGHTSFSHNGHYWSLKRTIEAWLGFPVTVDMQVGHINGNPLDTRHVNLQVLTPEENASIKKRNPNVDYVEHGIIYSRIINKYMVRVGYRDIKQRRNRHYTTIEEARMVRDAQISAMRTEIQDRPSRFEFDA
jgi:hypothetical protein